VSRQAISGWEAGTSRPSTENLQSLSRLFNIPLETLLDDTAEAEPAAAPEKLPAEEQAKEEGKGQGLGKDRRYKAIVMVIVLLAILLTTAVLAHRRTAQEKTGLAKWNATTLILLGPNLCRWRALAKGGERNAQTFVYGTDRSGDDWMPVYRHRRC
jgi:transcriptional regulator with XRE-family HTH domain